MIIFHNEEEKVAYKNGVLNLLKDFLVFDLAKIIYEYQSDIPQTFNIIVLGDKEVGKTSFIKRIVNETVDFCTYNPSLESNKLSSRQFFSSRGEIIINFIDTQAQSLIDDPFSLSEYPRFDGVVLMFSLVSRLSYKQLPILYRSAETDFARRREENNNNNNNEKGIRNTVLIGSHLDLRSERKVKPNQITFGLKKHLDYFEVSSETKVNIADSIIHLIRKLAKDEHLEIFNFFQIPIKAELLAEGQASRNQYLEVVKRFVAPDELE